MSFALFVWFKIQMPDNNPIVLKNLLCPYTGHGTQTITMFTPPTIPTPRLESMVGQQEGR